ncbi:MAG: insulinase family protein [Bacteroidia bacterium]
MRRTVLFASITFLWFSNQSWAQFNPQIERYTLDNGLTVILNYDEHQNGVFGAVGVKVGSKNDPDDATGMAHYQEHMLFKGTSQLGTIDHTSEKIYIDSIFLMYDELGNTKDEVERTRIQKTINRLSVKANEYAVPNEFSNLIKTIGGTALNAFTSPDMTVYHNSFPANQMEKWLELYSHRFIDPVFRGFQSELEVVYEEYNMNADNFAFNLFQEFQKNFFKEHPYGSKTTIGTVEHLKNPSLTKMYEFFETYYVANNMILVLSGNFNVENSKKLIENKFGRLKTGGVPEFNPPKEKPFVGRVKIEKKLSPIKIGAMGFRTVPQGHEDEYKLKIVNNLLNNSSGSGMLDELMLNNELLAAQVQNLPLHDEGATFMLFVPKIVGQKLEEAEQLVLEQIKKVHNGQFEDWMLESAKNSIYMEEQMKLESKTQIALDLINAEMLGLNLFEVFNASERIMALSKEEVVETAKKYYGKDYLAFYSKQNLSPGKEKVSKPNFEPVVPNGDAVSDYANSFKKINSDSAIIDLVNFEEDLKMIALTGSNKLYCTQNPKNDIFSMRIEYGVGSETFPMLEYAGMVMDLAGTESMSSSRLRDTFNYFNCSYSFGVSENKCWISLTGLERNLRELMPVLNELLTKPALESKDLKTIIQAEKTTRRLEKTEADALADALFEYMRYGNESSYLTRLSMKELKKLEPQTLISAYKKVLDYEATIHFVGTPDPQYIQELALEFIPLNEVPKISDSEAFKTASSFDKNTIYFVSKKNARQSKVFITMNEFPYQKEIKPSLNAFNLYFGGDFSGLVLQEIREYRSLAYSAGAYCYTPNQMHRPSGFVGFVGTQADKTNEAIDVYYDLIKNMPNKAERLDMVQDYLINKLQNDQPSFRSLSKTVDSWKAMEIYEDPRQELLMQYQGLTFSDITEFYGEFIQNNTLAIAICGDPREIDLESLELYGEVVILKSKDILKK